MRLYMPAVSLRAIIVQLFIKTKQTHLCRFHDTMLETAKGWQLQSQPVTIDVYRRQYKAQVSTNKCRNYARWHGQYHPAPLHYNDSATTHNIHGNIVRDGICGDCTMVNDYCFVSRSFDYSLNNKVNKLHQIDVLQPVDLTHYQL